jgi:hypothetical protein
MRRRSLVVAGSLATVSIMLGVSEIRLAGQAPSSEPSFKVPAASYAPPKTPWGDPDLQGVWDNHSNVPLERPARLAGKKTYTPEEMANVRRGRGGRNGGGGGNAGASIDQLDRVKAYDDYWAPSEGVSDNRTAQIEDPADGRIPPLTPEALAAQKAYLATHPSTDEGSDNHVSDWRGYDTRTRCISIQVPSGILSYNSANYIMQSPGWVMIALERLNTRLIPLDGRPHSSIRSWQGDSVGHWEGNTLVVETTNFLLQPSQGGGGSVIPNGISEGNVRLVEHFVPVGPKRLEYYATLDDPKTWTRPWTFMQPWEKDPVYAYEDSLGKASKPEPYQIFEYACHEGNRSLEADLKSSSEYWKNGGPSQAVKKAPASETVASLIGQSEADIRAKYGPPTETAGPRWQYRTTKGVFVVYVFFENGKVVRVRPDDLPLNEIAVNHSAR